MAAFTPYNPPEEIGAVPVLLVCSDAANNHQAILEIDEYARAHGYVRSHETTLNIKQDTEGRRFYYTACYLWDKDAVRAAESDLARIRERRERMLMTAPSADLLRDPS